MRFHGMGRAFGVNPLNVLIASLAVVLASCGTAGQEGTDSTTGSNEEETTLTMALPTLGTNDFSPKTSEEDNEKFLMLMGNNLVGLDPVTSEFIGELAESWEVSDDGLDWTFRLRPDVPFQGGWGTVTAEDVKWSWEQWTSEESTHTVRSIYRDAIAGSMDNFEIVSDLEFVLHADTPVKLLTFVCSCTPGMTVFPKAYYEEKGDEALTHPLGTGPWEYVSSKPGEEIVMESFDDYWGTVPEFDRLVLLEIPDGAARLAQVKAGAVDIAQLDGSLANEVEADQTLTIRGIPHITNAWVLLGGSYWGEGPSAEHLDVDAPWIQADNLEQGLAIREAMSLAIDRQAILDVALKGHGALSYAPLVQYPQIAALTDPSWELPVYDPELAREKLAEGGYPDGFEFKLMSYVGDIDTASMTEMLAGMWEEIGLTVTREQMEEGRLKQLESTYDTAGRVWIRLQSFSPDPVKPLATYRDDADVSPKITHPAIDAAYRAMQAEPDIEVRYALARELSEILEADKIAPSLMTGDMLFVSGPRIADWVPIPGLNTPGNLESVTLAP